MLIICHRFFHNSGAVVAVFLVVGLAAATICLWIFFFIRRRRSRRRIVQDFPTAAGYSRAPIDDDFDSGIGMRQRFGSFSSQPTINTPITDDERAAEATAAVDIFDPYAGYSHPVGGAGYIPARSESPSQHGRVGMPSGSYTSGVSRSAASGYSLLHDTENSDQLLSGVGLPIPTLEGASGPSPVIPSPPPRNPKRQPSPKSVVRSGLHDSDERPPPDYHLNPALNVTPRAEKKGGKARVM
jgi:hypothetical protein